MTNKQIEFKKEKKLGEELKLNSKINKPQSSKMEQIKSPKLILLYHYQNHPDNGHIYCFSTPYYCEKERSLFAVIRTRFSPSQITFSISRPSFPQFYLLTFCRHLF